MKLKILHPTATVPRYQTSGAAGFDFHASESITIMPGETALVSTGLAVELSPGTELQIRPRSGMSAKTKIRVGNSPGTIDEDYRNEIKIILDNTGHLPYTVQVGDRIAQGVVADVRREFFEVVDELSDTQRKGGFGSTGV